MVLQKYVFTISVVENIYHNPASKTAMASSPGTGISVFHHPIEMSTIETRIPLS